MPLPQLRRIRWAVRAALILGVAASVAANVLHARPNPISQAIAAWPPLALLLTVELTSRIPMHDARSPRAGCSPPSYRRHRRLGVVLAHGKRRGPVRRDRQLRLPAAHLGRRPHRRREREPGGARRPDPHDRGTARQAGPGRGRPVDASRPSQASRHPAVRFVEPPPVERPGQCRCPSRSMRSARSRRSATSDNAPVSPAIPPLRPDAAPQPQAPSTVGRVGLRQPRRWFRRRQPQERTPITSTARRPRRPRRSSARAAVSTPTRTVVTSAARRPSTPRPPSPGAPPPRRPTSPPRSRP